MMTYTCNLNTRESLETERSGAPRFEAGLRSMRPGPPHPQIKGNKMVVTTMMGVPVTIM